MAEDAADRTHAPTPKRIEDARRRGEVPNSRDVSGVVVLSVALGALAWLSIDALSNAVSSLARDAWGGTQIHPHTISDFHALLLFHGVALASGLLPFTLILLASGALVSFAQTGPLFSVQALGFKASRISPAQGIRRLFAQERLFDLAKAPLKVALVALAFYVVLGDRGDSILGLFSAPPANTLRFAFEMAFRVSASALAALSVLAVLDLIYVRHRHTRRLRMTTREVRDELRDR